MIPTQPTPEEQVEAQRIAWDILRETPSSKDGWYSIQEASKVALAFIDLLTQQSQEPQNAQEWAAEAGQLHDKVVRLQAELDRAVERENRLTAALEAIERGEDEDPAVVASDALEEEYGLASPGKGAEGDCHGNCGAEYANFNCPKCRDPGAAPIEDEEEA